MCIWKITRLKRCRTETHRNYKKDPSRNATVKNTISEIKNSLYGLNDRLGRAMEMTREPKDWYTRLHDRNKLNCRSGILLKKETAKK